MAGSFRSLMDRLIHREPLPTKPESSEASKRLELLLQSYRDNVSIHPDFQKDVIQLCMGAFDIAETLANPLYSVDEFLRSAGVLQAVLANLTQQVRTQRPKIDGFGIVFEGNKKLLSYFSSSKEEAEKFISQLSAFSGQPTSSYAVIEVQLSSFFVKQPTQLPGDNSFLDILQPPPPAPVPS